MSENICKFCGAGQQGEDTLGYQCASWRYREIDYWVQSAVCQQRSLKLRLQHEQTIEVLRKRMAKAIEAANMQSRWPSGEFVEIVEARALDLVVEILEGKQ